MKTLLSLLLTFFTIVSFCQISVTKVAEAKKPEVVTYDSTKNYLKDTPESYVGQQLFVIPKDERLREYGYGNFQSDYKKTSYSNAKYESLVEKTFNCIGIKTHKSKKFLVLKSQETGNIIYFKHDKFKHNFPFLVVGYFEKIKLNYIGMEILVRPFKPIGDLKMKTINDIDTGEKIEFNAFDFGKCIDVTIESEYYELALIVENNRGQKYAVAVDYADRNPTRLFLKQDVEKYIKKWGKEKWAKIYNEKLLKGFTKEMCRLSWGNPKDINNASYGSQWVYDDQYIYFKDGKLTSWN